MTVRSQAGLIVILVGLIGVRSAACFAAPPGLGISKLAASQPTPKVRSLSAERDPLPVSKAIDQEIDRRLAAAKIPPSPAASDAEFLRRASLDIRGRIPNLQETMDFLASKAPDRRRKLIDTFLADEEYGEHFAIIWYHRMVKPSPDNRLLISTSYRDWLADRFNENIGWDRLVTEIMTAAGDRDENPATVFWLVNTEATLRQDVAPNKIAVAASQMFLGVKLECCECHNHPFDNGLKQTDFWSMAAFFTGTHANDSAKPKIKAGAVPDIVETGRVRPGRRKKDDDKPDAAPDPIAPVGSIVIPDTQGKIVPARFLLEQGSVTGGSTQLRSTFATWLTSSNNPYFAKAAVNRLWANCFGRGLIDPVDDLRSESNSHPEILALLTEELVASDFDLKHILRCLCNTQTYQRSSQPLPNNKADEALYSHMRLRTMSADMLFDSLTVALDHKPASNERKGRGKKLFGGQESPRDRFLSFFHVEADDDAGVMEEYTHGIPQVLRLMNSDELNDTRTVVSHLAQLSRKPADLIEGVYLRALSRRPTAGETTMMTRYLTKSPDRVQAYNDLMWALLNSSEFVFNH